MSHPILGLEPVTPDPGGTHGQQVLEGVRARFGRALNVYSRMAVSPGMLETYLEGNQRFQRDSGFSPAELQVVYLTISHFNRCDYCIAAHSRSAALVAKMPEPEIKSLRDGQPLADLHLEALRGFTEKLLRNGGRVSVADVAEFVSAGFREEQVVEIVFAIGLKTMTNWTNHLFETPLDDYLESYAWHG